VTVAEPQFDDLYREVILDHVKRPRNHGALAKRTQHAEGMNPVCGDEIELDLSVGEDAIIDDIAFVGQGCAISQSSASMLTERVKGQSVGEAEFVAAAFKAMLMDGADPAPELGDLEALQGVAKFPVRVKCALLCWNVLREGLEQAKRKQPEEAH
jgi:nitrogen fixation NifU-like protein